MESRTHVIGLIMLISVTVWAQTPEDVSHQFEPSLASITVEDAIQMSVDLQVIDANYLVAVQRAVTDALAYDEQGNTLPIDNSSNIPPYYQALSYQMEVNPDGNDQDVEDPNGQWFIDVLQPFHLCMDINKDANGVIPASLSEVSWTNPVLLAKYYCLVDIPFMAGDYWYELAGGTYLCIDLAESSEGEFNYVVTLETQDEVALADLNIRVRSEIPSLYIGPPELLDNNGQVIQTTYHTMYGHGSGSSTGTDTRYLTCSGAYEGDRRVTTLRLILARDLYEATASFTLTDIPVATPQEN